MVTILRLLAGSIIALAVLGCSSATQGPVHLVFDLENNLESHQETRLDSLLLAHERRTGNQIVVVSTPSFGGKRPVEFAVAFGDSLGVGQKGRDNGVVIAYSKKERGVFIATGRGTEHVLHDSICARFVDHIIIPHFREGRIYEGLWAGSLAVVEFLDKPEHVVR